MLAESSRRHQLERQGRHPSMGGLHRGQGGRQGQKKNFTPTSMPF
jgi:hypothetical protein